MSPLVRTQMDLLYGVNHVDIDEWVQPHRSLRHWPSKCPFCVPRYTRYHLSTLAYFLKFACIRVYIRFSCLANIVVVVVVVVSVLTEYWTLNQNYYYHCTINIFLTCSLFYLLAHQVRLVSDMCLYHIQTSFVQHEPFIHYSHSCFDSKVIYDQMSGPS